MAIYINRRTLSEKATPIRNISSLSSKVGDQQMNLNKAIRTTSFKIDERPLFFNRRRINS